MFLQTVLKMFLILLFMLLMFSAARAEEIEVLPISSTPSLEEAAYYVTSTVRPEHSEGISVEWVPLDFDSSENSFAVKLMLDNYLVVKLNSTSEMLDAINLVEEKGFAVSYSRFANAILSNNVSLILDTEWNGKYVSPFSNRLQKSKLNIKKMRNKWRKKLNEIEVIELDSTEDDKYFKMYKLK